MLHPRKNAVHPITDVEKEKEAALPISIATMVIFVVPQVIALEDSKMDFVAVKKIEELHMFAVILLITTFGLIFYILLYK